MLKPPVYVILICQTRKLIQGLWPRTFKLVH